MFPDHTLKVEQAIKEANERTQREECQRRELYALQVANAVREAQWHVQQAVEAMKRNPDPYSVMMGYLMRGYEPVLLALRLAAISLEAYDPVALTKQVYEAEQHGGKS